MISALAVRAVALASFFFAPHSSLADEAEDSRCEMRFSYFSFVLDRLTTMTYRVTLEGGYSEFTGFAPSSGEVVCRQQRFVLTPEEAHRLFDLVVSSEIFSLREKQVFERGFDKRMLGGGAFATLDFRGQHIEISRSRVSKSSPFRVVRTEIEEMLRTKQAEPGATDNPDGAHRLREDH